MVTIESAWIKRGYSRDDHLLDDSPLDDLIGREFRSLGDAKRAVARASTPGNPTRSPVGVIVRLASGALAGDV